MSYDDGVTTQNRLLMQNLLGFFANTDHIDKILPIINGHSHISLRIVDWFVTNYAKQNYIVYNGRFKVYNDYKLKLKAYSKRRFDPFCRWERIYIPYEHATTAAATTTAVTKTEPITTTTTTTAAAAAAVETFPPPPPPPGSTVMRMETTIGQLNFFKWAIENKILDYIEMHYSAIEDDMNQRNSSSKKNKSKSTKNRPSTTSTTTTAAATLPQATPTTTTDITANDNPGGGGEKKTRKKREELSVSACKYIKKEVVRVVVEF